MDDPRGVSRRALLLSAGVALGTVTVDGARKPLLAQADRPTADQLWSAGYVARKGDVSLALYRKRIGPAPGGEPPAPGRAAAGALPGPRLVGLGQAEHRPHGAGPGRVLPDERVRGIRIRRVDDGPRGLRQVGPHRRQFRRRERGGRYQGRERGGRPGDQAGARFLTST